MDIPQMPRARPIRCMHRRAATRFAAAIAGVLALILVVGGCSEQAASTSIAVTGAIAKSPSPRLDQLPNCTQMASILGDLVSDMVPSPSDGGDGVGLDGKFEGNNDYGVSCTWMTRESFSSDPYEAIKQGAAFGMGITVDSKHPQEEVGLRSIGLVYDDPRAQAIGGFVVSDPETNLADQLGVAGPLVVVGDVVVTMSATGAFLQKTDSTRAITLDRAIGAAVDLHTSLQ